MPSIEMPVEQARPLFTMPCSHVQTTGNTVNVLQVFQGALVTCAPLLHEHKDSTKQYC